MKETKELGEPAGTDEGGSDGIDNSRLMLA